MYFFKRGGWQVQFLEADLKTSLPRKLTFTDPEKIRELARRGGAWRDSESRQMLEYAIEVGRGGAYLFQNPPRALPARKNQNASRLPPSRRALSLYTKNVLERVDVCLPNRFHAFSLLTTNP
jgi:hypothetical protein